MTKQERQVIEEVRDAIEVDLQMVDGMDVIALDFEIALAKLSTLLLLNRDFE